MFEFKKLHQSDPFELFKSTKAGIMDINDIFVIECHENSKFNEKTNSDH